MALYLAIGRPLDPQHGQPRPHRCPRSRRTGAAWPKSPLSALNPYGSCFDVSVSIAAVDLRARRGSANAVAIGTIETSPMRSRAEAAVERQ
jgi:hypothetical protein